MLFTVQARSDRSPYGPKNVRFTMERRNDIVMQLCVACLGAGVITTVDVAQGQNPITALGITLFSAIAAVMVGQML
ncbi:hypothetical protein [Synechococcus sp. M16CYN]|uniref:hypothetical protein n=1 Tax=Synechococcus sp. M16CYN TaxID=3103139 RepID=UPI00324BD1C1